MSSKLQKFTFNEAFNAITPQNLGYDVQPLWSWALEDSIPETSTKYLNVSDAYKLTLQCGDWMHIKFFSLDGLDDIAPDGGFNVDVASSTTGTHWTTGADWSISGGRAISICDTFNSLTSTNSSLLSANQAYKLSFDAGTHKYFVNEGQGGGMFQISQLITYYYLGSTDNGSMSGVNGSGNVEKSQEGGVGRVEEWFIPTHNTNFSILTASNHHIYLDNLQIIGVPSIDRDADFAIPPGIHEMVVPRGYMNEQIYFAALPYNNYTEALGSQFLRIVKHG